MAQVLGQNGHARQSATPTTASVLIVNTCGFHGGGARRRIAGRPCANWLRSGAREGQMVIAAGCLCAATMALRLVQGCAGAGWRNRHATLDGYFQTGASDCARGCGRSRCITCPRSDGRRGRALDERGVLRASIQGASAWLKIADGCRRPCAFCTIPKIKGSSRQPAAWKRLVELRRGSLQARRRASEMILIAQDSERLRSRPGAQKRLWRNCWRRWSPRRLPSPGCAFMYAWPGYVTPRL